MARPSNREVRQENIRNGLFQNSRRYDGEVLLAPSAANLAKALGRTTGYIYRDGDYSDTLERVSGLTVIHNGFVLAGEVSQSVAAVPKIETIDFSSLSATEMVSLIGKLTTQLSAKIS